jgi:hypothetical protein
MARYVNAASSELLYKQRLRRLLVRSLTVTGQMRELGLVPKLAAIVPEQARLLRRSLAVQEETLALIGETLAIAKETERHAESLDNKTGGSGTTVVPPPTEGTPP